MVCFHANVGETFFPVIYVVAETKISEHLSKEENKAELETLQIGAIRHYLTVVKMICFEYSPIADTHTIETLLGLIKKLSFLTCPDGIFQKLLSSEDVSFEIKKLCLKVLNKILSIRYADVSTVSIVCLFVWSLVFVRLGRVVFIFAHLLERRICRCLVLNILIRTLRFTTFNF
jgi:hypothetical protein